MIQRFYTHNKVQMDHVLSQLQQTRHCDSGTFSDLPQANLGKMCFQLEAFLAEHRFYVRIFLDISLLLVQTQTHPLFFFFCLLSYLPDPVFLFCLLSYLPDILFFSLFALCDCLIKTLIACVTFLA